MKDLNFIKTPTDAISEPQQKENIPGAPNPKPYCICCGEKTLWAENQKKLLEHVDSGLLKKWPSDIPISAIPSHDEGNRPGGIVCTQNFHFIKGSKLLKKLKLGKMHQVTVRTYICHTCGATWTTETEHEI